MSATRTNSEPVVTNLRLECSATFSTPTTISIGLWITNKLSKESSWTYLLLTQQSSSLLDMDSRFSDPQSNWFRFWQTESTLLKSNSKIKVQDSSTALCTTSTFLNHRLWWPRKILQCKANSESHTVSLSRDHSVPLEVALHRKSESRSGRMLWNRSDLIIYFILV